MKRPDDELEELESQSEIDNSRLEELIDDMDEGLVGIDKQEEFLELLKKSQLFMPVVFGPEAEEEFKNGSPGEVSVTKQPIGFNINYLQLAEGKRALPLFTSRELLKSAGVESSIIAIFMEDLADLLKQTDNYSLVSINPFTDLLVDMPTSSFLALFGEISAEEKEAMDEVIRILKTRSMAIPEDIQVIYRDDENQMKKEAVDGIFTTKVPFKASSSPDFQKELKYTNIILIPKNKKLLYFGGIVSEDMFDTIFAPETEFKMVDEINDFTTVWEIGNQPFYDDLDIDE